MFQKFISIYYINDARSAGNDLQDLEHKKLLIVYIGAQYMSK